eukprot:CAMPEP_0177671532 /NCGR_PEP_ID=MMETSP0447-20121125/24768_1 /TAXON_ID=0 /ORGANISM="Stygamoeba regulata, Strain BSH-02190019" /LENGTH=952 /DNA_ID=CAMNT_0019178959 /DNA_START=82 /DNA_END=2942 /DNA_ORIENTATION=+
MSEEKPAGDVAADSPEPQVPEKKEDAAATDAAATTTAQNEKPSDDEEAKADDESTSDEPTAAKVKEEEKEAAQVEEVNDESKGSSAKAAEASEDAQAEPKSAEEAADKEEAAKTEESADAEQSDVSATDEQPAKTDDAQSVEAGDAKDKEGAEKKSPSDEDEEDADKEKEDEEKGEDASEEEPEEPAPPPRKMTPPPPPRLRPSKPLTVDGGKADYDESQYYEWEGDGEGEGEGQGEGEGEGAWAEEEWEEGYVERKYLGGGGGDGEKTIWWTEGEAQKKAKAKYLDWKADETEEIQETEVDISLEGTPAEVSYTAEKTIGRTAFGLVKTLKHKSSGEQFTGKLIALHTDPFFDKEALASEAKHFEKLEHAHLPTLKEYLCSDELSCFVFSKFDGPDLYTYLSTVSSYTESLAHKFIKQVVDTVAYLHNQGLVHRDILPDHFFFDSPDSDQLKLVDLRQAREIGADPLTESWAANPYFQPPELITHAPYTSSVDIWSIGVFAHVLLCGHAPFQEKHKMRLAIKIKKCEFSLDGPEWESISADAKNFLSKILVANASDRPSITDVQSHPWIQNGPAVATPIPDMAAKVTKFLQASNNKNNNNNNVILIIMMRIHVVSSLLLLHHHNHFADVFTVHHVIECVNDILESVTMGFADANLAGGDPFGHRPQKLAFLLLPIGHKNSLEFDAFGDDDPVAIRTHARCGSIVASNRSALSHTSEEIEVSPHGIRDGTTHVVEEAVDAVGCSGGDGGRHVLGGLVVDGHIEAALGAKEVTLLVGARSADHSASVQPGDLSHHRAYGTGGAGYQHRLTLFGRAHTQQAKVGGHRGHAETAEEVERREGRLVGGQCRQTREGVLAHQDVLTPRGEASKELSACEPLVRSLASLHHTEDSCTLWGLTQTEARCELLIFFMRARMYGSTLSAITSNRTSPALGASTWRSTTSKFSPSWGSPSGQ